MEFEGSVLIAFVLMGAAAILDWPRALAGLIFGIVSRFLPYGTIVVPLGVVAISAIAEFVYPVIGRSTGPSFGSFLLGVLSTAGTASTFYITMRNLKDRL